MFFFYVVTYDKRVLFRRHDNDTIINIARGKRVKMYGRHYFLDLRLVFSNQLSFQNFK